MTEIVRQTPNARLKRAREARGWSQKYVSQEVGTDAFTVSRWERGISLPSPHFRQQLCTLFAMSVRELGLLNDDGGEDKSSRHTPCDHVILFDPTIPPLATGEKMLVGRDGLLHHLKRRLITEDGLRLAFNGLPGIGKTALATAMAHDEELRKHFCDGVLWAGLGQAADPIGLLSHWAALLGATPPGDAQARRLQPWVACVHAAIGERRMLIIIDDAWESEHALALHVGGSHCAHLVTTRFPQIAQRCAASNTLVIGELEESDARLLLMRLAPGAVQMEPEAVQMLTTFVGGLPLALTLLGNYVRVHTYSGQARRLRSVLAGLRCATTRLQLSEPQTLIGVHPSLSAENALSLQAVIGLSDEHLSTQARFALRALALFPPKPDSFAEEAATAICALPVEVLDELQDAGLLESAGAGRYTLHQTIVDYARTQPVDTEVQVRFVDYFVRFVETHSNDYPAINQEYHTIIATLDLALAQKMRPAFLRATLAFAPALLWGGRYSVAEPYLQHTYDAARALEEKESQARACLYLGNMAEQQASYTDAHAHWQRGLHIATMAQHSGLQAEFWMHLGVLARQRGSLEQAHRCFQFALTNARQANDHYRLGAILRNLGILLREQGQPGQARQYTQEALATFQRIDHHLEIARTLNSLGILARHQGEPEQARQFYEQAIAIFQQLGDQRGAAVSLGNLARIVSIHQGELQHAHHLYQEALTIFERLGDRRNYAQILHGMGSLLWDMGQADQAEQTLELALKILREIGDRHTAALTLGELGIHAREQGHLGRATDLLTEALTTLREMGDRREEGAALRELGALARMQGSIEQAATLLHEALAILAVCDDRRELALAHYELGILFRLQERQEEARTLLQRAQITLNEIGDKRTGTLARRELLQVEQKRQYASR